MDPVTASGLLLIVVLVAVLLWTRRRLTYARAESKLRLARIARLAHELVEMQIQIDDLTWSRDQALLDNAALRGEYAPVEASS